MQGGKNVSLQRAASLGDAVHNKPELRARRSRKVRNREQETKKKKDHIGPFVQNAQQEAAW